jgi:hypothetical protein
MKTNKQTNKQTNKNLKRLLVLATFFTYCLIFTSCQNDEELVIETKSKYRHFHTN